MAKNISLMGASYSDVPAVVLPQTGGGTARFDDASVTTATAADVAQGKVFIAADGTITTGTASGGGSIVVVDTPDGHGGTIREITATDVTTLVEKTITQNGTYDPGNDNADGYSSVTVNVGGGISADEIVERTISGVVEGSAATIGSYAFYNCSQITGASFPNAGYINSCAFYYCFSLSYVSFPNVSTIGTSAFYACRGLSEVSFPNAYTVSDYAFCQCSALETVSFPNLSTIGSSAFMYCSALLSVNLPNLATMGTYAFAYCINLSYVSMPLFSGSLPNEVFQNCSSLRTADFPNATSVGIFAFCSCIRLSAVSFPNATAIYSNAFSYCSSLTAVEFPKVTKIYNGAFKYCENLTTASFPAVTNFYTSYTFSGCYRLLSLYLMGSSVASLASANVFASTPLSGYTTYTGGVYGSIYVPASLYSSYIRAHNWSYYSSRFVSV